MGVSWGLCRTPWLGTELQGDPSLRHQAAGRACGQHQVWLDRDSWAGGSPRASRADSSSFSWGAQASLGVPAQGSGVTGPLAGVSLQDLFSRQKGYLEEELDFRKQALDQAYLVGGAGEGPPVPSGLLWSVSVRLNDQWPPGAPLASGPDRETPHTGVRVCRSPAGVRCCLLCAPAEQEGKPGGPCRGPRAALALMTVAVSENPGAGGDAVLGAAAGAGPQGQRGAEH